MRVDRNILPCEHDLQETQCGATRVRFISNWHSKLLKISEPIVFPLLICKLNTRSFVCTLKRQEAFLDDLKTTFQYFVTDENVFIALEKYGEFQPQKNCLGLAQHSHKRLWD